jgi:hypothetical protein
MTTVEDPGAALQKPDALPEVAATYCLPLTAYVSTPPFIGPPVLNL